ncbi:MAG: phosphatidylserine decarboxylase family protein [Planctomycetaceae bacterium]|nr:phosphatidylserine decarboxylase family protein [Planctomycetaceae bacterium]
MIRFAQYGRYELSLYVTLSLALAALSAFGLSAWLSPWIGIPLAIIFFTAAGFVFWFFRDPEREIAGLPTDIVSPADGTVTDVKDSATCAEYIGGGAAMLGIFLSVFDVHINRAPLDGDVRYLRYKAGKFLDVRHPDCPRLNEQQAIGFEANAAGGARVLVRQIAGLIARRIVCDLKPGSRLKRGERFGMIKFGSRTEIWIGTVDARVEWLVKPGDHVKGGSTILGTIHPSQPR